MSKDIRQSRTSNSKPTDPLATQSRPYGARSRFRSKIPDFNTIELNTSSTEIPSKSPCSPRLASSLRITTLAVLGVPLLSSPTVAQINDCGDSKTVIERTVTAPQSEDEKLEQIDWAELARLARGEPPSDKKNHPETTTIRTEGCALDERETDALPKGELSPPEGMQVVETGIATVHPTTARGADASSKSIAGTESGRAPKAAGSKVSAKEEKPTIDAELLEKLMILALSLLSFVSVFVLARYLPGIILGILRRRKTCRIPVMLFTGRTEFPGQITVLGKFGLRFLPKDPHTMAALKKLLGEDHFYEFDITIGDRTKAVFVDSVDDPHVTIFFVEKLGKKEQDRMLSLSTVDVRFDSWRPVKKGRAKLRRDVIDARLKKLKEMRNAEIRRRKMAEQSARFD